MNEKQRKLKYKITINEKNIKVNRIKMLDQLTRKHTLKKCKQEYPSRKLNAFCNKTTVDPIGVSS